MTKYLSKLILLLISATILSSCTSPALRYIENVPEFKKVIVRGGDFQITTFQKIHRIDSPYVFYIEGDGAAFTGKYKVSNNPTPHNPMLLELATMDNRPNIVYVARPCQYTPMELNPKCTPNNWTNERMSNDNVHALNEAINKINNGHKFSLIGFSGGGGIAILIATRNNMVKDIVTIAGNLDHSAFTTFHSVSPMKGSLNPIDYVTQARYIPQLHLSGGQDATVPPFIAKRFVQASDTNCVKHKIYERSSHNKGWNDVWQDVLMQPIKCAD